MTPDFALHLSFDGITLDQRQPSGWATLGRAEFTSANLAADLAALRSAGQAAAGAGRFATKLVLPNDQVKLLTLRDSTPSRTSVGMALEGATPYAVTDLEFDWRVANGKTHVAAVAKETLAEAEAFAREHHFEPIAFVCLPDDGWNGEEAFFGPVRGMGAVDVRRDPRPYAPAEADAREAETAAEPVRAEPDVAVPEAAEPEPESFVQTTEPLVDVEPAETQTPPPPQVAIETQDASAPEAVTEVAPAAPVVADSDDSAPAPAPALQAALVTEDTAPKLLGATAPSLDDIVDQAPRLSLRATQDEPAAPAPQLGAARDPDADVDVAVTGAAATLRPAAVTVEDSAAGAPTGGMFRSRRRAARPEAKVAAKTDKPSRNGGVAALEAGEPTAARVGGKPRFLGLILTALLILGLLAVAAFATGLSSERFSRLFGPQADIPEVAALPPGSIAMPDSEMVADGAVLDDIIQTPLDDEPAGPAVPLISDAELARSYAATGIWQRAPDAPRLPAGASLDSLYVASIDTNIGSQDAVALPDTGLGQDVRPASQPLPPAFGVTFDVDANGLIIATPEGTIAPGGYTVIAGRPALTPPLRVSPTVEGAEDLTRLAAFRPRARPDDLAEAQERFDLGGFTRSELAAFRPRIRPQAAKQAAEAAAAAREEAANAAALAAAETAQDPVPEAIVGSRFAVSASARPSARPNNFARVVANARKSQPTTVERVAAVAPRTTRPSGATRASVARAATTDNAINLRRVNLIGVYGKPSNRQALVRLANGRFVKVKVGDRVDGGRVAAIGESQIRYVKGGRNITLDIPS